MYSRRHIALIFQDFQDERAVEQRIRAAPTYIDRIYVLGASDTWSAASRSIAEIVASEPERVIYLASGNESPGSLAAVYLQVIQEGFDLAVIVVGDNYFDYKLLPYLLDPIVWGEADYVKGVKHTMPSAPSPDDSPQMSSSYYIEQTSILPKSSDVMTPSRFFLHRRGPAAVSRDGLEVLRQELLKERLWRSLVAVPCYNEEMMIASVVLRARAFVDDVLVVDDGSSDRTAVLAKEAGAIVITHKVNRGYGGAIRTCFEYARDNGYDVMVILDGDGQHDPAGIPDMLQMMRQTGADIVIGSRFLGAQDGIPFYRRIGQQLLDLATSSSSGTPITDTQCGFRAYGPKAIAHISVTDDSMGAGSEILAVANEQGLQLVEIPVRVRYDLKDTSSQHPITHGIDVVVSIAWRMLMRRPVVWIALPGLLLTSTGLYSVFKSMLSLIDGRTTSIEVMVIGSVILTLGFLSLFMGLTIAMLNRTVIQRRERNVPSGH